MIKIDFYRNGFVCQGHANSAKFNHDLVCAGVSAIVMGSLNWFDDNDKSNIVVVGDNLIKVTTNSIDLLKLLNIQLTALVHGDYAKYVQVNNHEILLEEDN